MNNNTGYTDKNNNPIFVGDRVVIDGVVYPINKHYKIFTVNIKNNEYVLVPEDKKISYSSFNDLLLKQDFERVTIIS